MMLRKPVLILMFFTVIAPIVLYTDTLGTFKNSPSGSEFLEELSTSSFSGDSRILNVLPQESSITLKEPIGIVYSDDSDSDPQAATRDVSSIISESTDDSGLPQSVEHKSRALYTTNSGDFAETGNNPIRLVTNTLPQEDQNDLEGHGSTSNEEENRDGETLVKEIRPPLSNQTFNNASMKVDIKSEPRSSQTATKADPKEPVKSKTEKQDDRMVLPDAQIRQLKDQLIRSKVYLSLVATKNNPHFIRELRLRVKEVQRALGDATKDTDLPRNAYEKLKAMEQTLAKGKQIQDDCSAVVKKLRAMLHSTEEQLRVHRKQTMFLTQLTAKTLPKGLHCLPLRLSTEYYGLSSSQQQFPGVDKLEDPKLYHYALFSDNILAASVVVNSTISHAKDPAKHVFHVVTDRLNYAAMRMWFLSNPPEKATIQVQNVEEFTWLNASYSPVLKQLSSAAMIDYYFKAQRANSDPNIKFRNPKYLSILNHLRFYLPEIFPKLNKVLFLDDDIVVQKDVTGLWSTDLNGNVNGAVETCGESFHRFDRYLNFSNPLISKNFDPHACGWAYGMNIFDLDQWKTQNITEVYHSWQKLNHDRQLWKLGTLPPGLITFWKRTYPLNKSWHVLGLGYNPNVNPKDIERAAVIHYNGNMKPWLEIGITKYRNYWARFVNYEHSYLRECNINP